MSGYTEVAGQSARVIVANPYGISCNGCGFINTPRVTLTTGKPVLDNGRLDRFQVDQGSVSIDGTGINATNVDRFEIITRSAKINAQIQANNLTIVAGRNDVNADTLNATARANDGSSQPALAIDSSALGGMYAGAIKLVGTEAGVGVKLDGKLIASGGDIQLDANGHLSLADTSAANGAVNIKASSLDARAPVYAGTALNVQTQGDLSNQQSLAARDRINLSAGGQLTNNGVIEAGVNADSSRNASGDVSLGAQNLANSGHSVVASRNLTVNAAQTLNNQGGTLSGQQNTTVSAATLDNQNKGRVLSADRLNLAASLALNGQGGLINSSGALTAKVGHLVNHEGLLSANGTLNLTADIADNDAGTLSSKGDLTADIHTLNQQGGVLVSQGNLSLTGHSFDNRNAGLVGGVKGTTLTFDSIDNRGGELSSTQGVTLTSQHLNNSDSGKVLAGTDLKLTVADLLNQTGGQLVGKVGTTTISGTRLDNSGGILRAQSALVITLDNALTNQLKGLISSEGTLSVHAGSLDNSGGSLSSAGQLSLTSSGALINQGGRLVTDSGLDLRSASLDNRQKGTISGQSAVLINTGHFDNSHGGFLSSGDSLNLTTAQLTNQDGGRIGAAKALTASVTGLDQQGGELKGETALTLDLNHGQLNNQGGMINAPILVLSNLKGVNNQGGEISSAQALTIAAESLDNGNGKLLSNQALTLRIEQALSSIKGMIAAAAVDVHTGSLDNSGGTLTSRAKLGLTIDGQLTNQNQGLINATTALTINSAGLNNQSGSLQGSAIAIDFGSATGDLNNAAGHIVTAGNLSIDHLRDLNNQGGELSSVQSINLTARTLDNSNAGKLISNTLLNLTAGSLINQNGGLFSGWQGLSLNGSSLDNRNNGTVSSRSGNVDVTIGGALLNSGAGALVSQNVLTVNAGSLDNSNQGALSSVGGQSITVSGLLNNAQGGVIGSGAALTLNAMTLGNTGGTVNAQQTLSFTGSQINNQGGELSSQGQMILLTGGLDNSNHGTVGATDSLKLTATGAVQNTAGGLIASRNADLQLTAASLGNARGSLQGKGAVNLDVAGDIDNQSGKIIAQDGDLTLKAANTDSRGGVLSSVKGALEARVGILKNGYDLTNNRQGGTLQAQRLNLQAWGGIDNYGGRIAAQNGDAVIATGAGNFDNRNGGLYAKGQVNVTGNNFDNSGDNDGQIAGNQITLNLNGALNNRLGIIESDSTLAIKAASLDNQTGQLRALGTSGKTNFQIGGLFDNRNGTLESANTDLTLGAGSFLNTGGSLLHVGTGTFDISTANVMGAGGTLVTRGGLTLNADTWTNSSVIQAGRLNVNVNSLTQTASGQLLATDSFIGSGVNWFNEGLIASDGSLNLGLGGAYWGAGRLSSQGALGLSAAQVNLNSVTSSIAGGSDTRLNVSGQLDNAGRLTSGAGMTVMAGGVRNFGTLGTGGDLTLTTGALSNNGGLIFSGGNMSLRVADLNNTNANVYSLGNLSIDRDGQGGLANSIVNSSATLQSDGSMSLAASTIQNVRTVLNVDNKGIYTASITNTDCTIMPKADCDGGKEHYAWKILQREKLEASGSSASSIAAGNNLSISGGQLLNQSSSISSGGNLSATLSSLTNSGLETGETETSRIYRSERTRDPDGWFNAARAFTNQYWYQSSGYTGDISGLNAAMASFIGSTETELPALRQVTKLASGDQSFAAIIQAAGAININAQNTIDNSVIRPGYTYIGSGARTDTGAAASPYSTRITLNQQLPPNLAQQQVNPLALPGFSLPSGQNGLFRLSSQGSSTVANTAPQSWTMGGANLGTAQRQLAPGDLSPSSLTVAAADRSLVTQPISVARVQGLPDTSGKSNPNKYLIETNPVLTDLKQFMSSDYLLANLGFDPDKSAKRLGDGLYEQKLIQQAVVARTGQRFIDGQTSDAALFKYLMNNAVTSKQQLNLSLGVSLTSEQVAALTHDIVWMENATVNGEQVLVPVLYLANANNRLAANGALIQGSDVTLIAGKDLNNAGTLRASSNLSAAAGNDLVNSGLVEAGNRLDLLAGNNLVNKAGGIIAGRDVSLTAIKGDVINERTVTTHESASDSRSEQRSFVDSAARIEAANNLTINAGRDFNNTGGVLKSGADTTISAGRDVNIASAEQIDSNEAGPNHRNQTITQYGSSVDVGRDLKVDAGRDLTAIASQIDAKRDIAMAATENLTLASAANEQHSYSKTKEVKSQEDHVHQVSTSLTAGGNVALNAGKDMTLISSRISAGDEAYLVAGDKLELLAAQDSDYSLYDMKKKGSWGSKETQRDEVTKVTNVGSEIKTGGDLTLASGGDQKYQVAKLESGKDITLQSGGAITFEGVKDLHDESHTKSDNNAFWTSSKGKGNTDETLRQSSLIAAGNLTIKAVDGLKIDIKHIDQKSVSQTIDAMVQADPQLAWLKQAEARGDVDWRQVKEIHESFKYSNSGLGPASQLIIAIALAAVMGPMMAGMNSMLQAASLSVATKATVSTINNRGNLGKVVKDVTSKDSIKGYVVSAATAGVAKGLNYSPGSVGFDVKSLQTVAMKVAADAVIKTAVYGGSFKDNLASSAAGTAASIGGAVGAGKIGDLGLAEGDLTKIALHAGLGGLLAEAMGGDFRTGAIAGGANEVLVGLLGDKLLPSNLVPGSPEYNRAQANLMALSQVVGVLGAAASGGDSDIAAAVAANATQYNFLGYHSQAERDRALKEYEETKSLDAAKKMMVLQGADQRSDGLLERFHADPASLSSSEKTELAAYLQVYGYEQSLKYGEEAARTSIDNLLKNGPVPYRDYPFAGGTTQERIAYADGLRAQDGVSVANIFWSRDQSASEMLYRDAQGYLRINREMQAMSDVGSPALYFLTGNLGTTIRVAAAANGGLQAGHGAGQVYDGDTWNGIGNLVIGLMNVASLGIPKIGSLGRGSASIGAKEVSVAKGPATDLLSGETKVVGDGAPAANDASFTGAKATGAALESEATGFFGQQRKYWSQEPIQFNGNKVYQRNDLVDPSRVDSQTGLTNLDLMKNGLAPYGPDGKKVNLHHMLQTQDGPIAEVTQSFHQQNSGAIHINSGSDIPSGINRSQFEKWKKDYWRSRANNF